MLPLSSFFFFFFFPLLMVKSLLVNGVVSLKLPKVVSSYEESPFIYFFGGVVVVYLFRVTVGIYNIKPTKKTQVHCHHTIFYFVFM